LRSVAFAISDCSAKEQAAGSNPASSSNKLLSFRGAFSFTREPLVILRLRSVAFAISDCSAKEQAAGTNPS